MSKVGTLRGQVLIALNERGNRIGETHHNASIPDAVVEQIRDWHELDGWGYLRICREIGLSLSTVSKICTYARRGQTASRWRSASLS